jgi:hypothetical protein
VTDPERHQGQHVVTMKRMRPGQNAEKRSRPPAPLRRGVGRSGGVSPASRAAAWLVPLATLRAHQSALTPIGIDEQPPVSVRFKPLIILDAGTTHNLNRADARNRLILPISLYQVLWRPSVGAVWDGCYDVALAFSQFVCRDQPSAYDRAPPPAGGRRSRRHYRFVT